VFTKLYWFVVAVNGVWALLFLVNYFEGRAPVLLIAGLLSSFIVIANVGLLLWNRRRRSSCFTDSGLHPAEVARQAATTVPK
jgi:hypothetical protein